MLHLWWPQHSQGCAEGLVLNTIGQWLCLAVREKVESGLTQKKLLVVVSPPEADSTEIEYNIIALQQRKHQRCNSSLRLQVIVLVLWKGERRTLPLEMDVSVGRREGQDGPTFGSPGTIINGGLPSEEHTVPALLNLGKNELSVPLAAWSQPGAPCAAHLQWFMHWCSSVWRGGLATPLLNGMGTTGGKLSRGDGWSYRELLREKAVL